MRDHEPRHRHVDGLVREDVVLDPLVADGHGAGAEGVQPDIGGGHGRGPFLGVLVAQIVSRPPVGLSVSPTKYDASSPARKAAAAAISLGRPIRPAGVVATTSATASSTASIRGIWTKPGAIALTRTP